MNKASRLQGFKAQGFKPGKLTIFIRYIARILIKFLQIKGSTKWGNEFIQQIDPFITVRNPLMEGSMLWFRTGHGRLLWRAVATPKQEIETNRWIQQFDKNSVFYDIGSNIGLYSLMAAKQSILVYSFEMEPLNVACQHENIVHNQLSSAITLIPIALSDSSSLRKVFYKSISPGDALHSIDKPSPSIAKENLNSVVTLTSISASLDDLVEMMSLTIPKYIKIDVDGEEVKVIQGGLKTLKSATSIMIETGKDSHEEVVKILDSIGFSVKEWYKSHSTFDPYSRNVLFEK